MKNAQLLMMANNRPTNGRLYNGYAAENMSLPDSFQIPSEADFNTLNSIASSDGGELKEVGFVHWDSPNTGANNATGFKAVGSGGRFTSFSGLKTAFNMWGNDGFTLSCFNNTTIISIGGGILIQSGQSLRAIYKGAGVPAGTFTDYNGFVYDVVTVTDGVDTQYWTLQNLKTTKLNATTDLVLVENQATWDAATASDYYYCSYNNDDSLISI